MALLLAALMRPRLANLVSCGNQPPTMLIFNVPVASDGAEDPRACQSRFMAGIVARRTSRPQNVGCDGWVSSLRLTRAASLTPFGSVALVDGLALISQGQMEVRMFGWN